jgi:hypothetical protein
MIRDFIQPYQEHSKTILGKLLLLFVIAGSSTPCPLGTEVPVVAATAYVSIVYKRESSNKIASKLSS